MRLRLFEELSAKQQALKFQQLVLENPYVRDIDSQLSSSDGKVFVRVTHPEFIDLNFNVEDKFSITPPSGHEQYGSTAEEAYRNAFPILIGLKAGIELEDAIRRLDTTLDIVGGTCRLNAMMSQGLGTAVFDWNIDKQGFEPVDEENLPANHGELYTTIEEMLGYLESFER